MEDRELCLECGSLVHEQIYAVYTGKDEEIAGFLCDSCRQKKKVKGLRNKNELHKLAALKEMLK
ncbi:hypothetical protein [Ammoniphilus sp. 3BR4]|uniref:hypothetical protein n=1 Tax=Ammoniphilus sp. 3BR4 TaxID=3158265 RepID=UPI0034655305